MTLPLPRYVIAKQLASAKVGFYFNVPKLYRTLGCSINNEPLGTDYSVACGPDGGRAAALNALFDEWGRPRTGEPVSWHSPTRNGRLAVPRIQDKHSLQRKSISTVAPDYERSMLMVADMLTKKGDRVGSRPVKYSRQDL